jgi:hypothetical protein
MPKGTPGSRAHTAVRIGSTGQGTCGRLRSTSLAAGARACSGRLRGRLLHAHRLRGHVARAGGGSPAVALAALRLLPGRRDGPAGSAHLGSGRRWYRTRRGLELRNRRPGRRRHGRRRCRRGRRGRRGLGNGCGRRGGCGLGFRCGRRRGRRRGGGSPRREQRERIDIRVAVADADAEVDVRHVVLGDPRRPRLGDRLPLLDGRTALDEERTDMSQRRLVAVGGDDRHGQPVGRNLTGERDLTRSRCAHDEGLAERDVDPAVLPARIRVVAERELPEHRSVRGPRPRLRTRRGEQRPADRHQGRNDQLRCPRSQHITRVAAAQSGSNAVDEVVTETPGRGRSATSR